MVGGVGQVVPEGAQAGDFGLPEALGVGGGSDGGAKSEGLDGERASAADGPFLGERDGDGSGESALQAPTASRTARARTRGPAVQCPHPGGAVSNEAAQVHTRRGGGAAF